MGFVSFSLTDAAIPLCTHLLHALSNQVPQNIPRQPFLFYWKYVTIATIPKECN